LRVPLFPLGNVPDVILDLADYRDIGAVRVVRREDARLLVFENEAIVERIDPPACHGKLITRDDL